MNKKIFLWIIFLLVLNSVYSLEQPQNLTITKGIEWFKLNWSSPPQENYTLETGSYYSLDRYIFFFGYGIGLNETNLNKTIKSYSRGVYGSMWLHDDAGHTIDLITLNAYENITDFNSTYNNGFTFANNHTLITNKTGIYGVDYSVSFSGSINSEIDFGVGINGVQQNDTHTHRTITGTSVGVTSGTGILNLTEGDVITLMVADENAPVNDISVVTAQLRVFQMVQVGNLTVNNTIYVGGTSFSANQSVNTSDNVRFGSVNASGNLSTGDCLILNGSCLRDWRYVNQSFVDHIWSIIGSKYIGNFSGVLDINESILNNTIANISAALDTDTKWSITGYIGNFSGSLDVNETILNATIDARDDVGLTANQSVNTSDNVRFNEVNVSNYLFINGSRFDIPGTLNKGDMGFFYNNSKFNILPRPTGAAGTFYIKNTVAGNYGYALQASSPSPTLNYVLGQGNSTSGRNMVITNGDSIFFPSASGKSMTLKRDTDAIQLTGNLTIASGQYMVENNQFAYAGASFPLAGEYFNAAATQFEKRNTVGTVVMSVDALGTNDPAFVYELRIGTNNGAGGLTEGDLNITDLYYNNLVPKSPFTVVFDDYYIWLIDYYEWDISGKKELLVSLDENYTVIGMQGDQTSRILEELNNYISNKINSTNYENDRIDCESQMYYIYTDYHSWLNGSRECIFNLDWANSDCRDMYGRYYYYNRNGCVLDEVSYCESVIWQVWRGNQCIINPQLECLYNQTTKFWNFTSNSCEDDEQRSCINQGCGYYWDGDSCEFSRREYDYCKSQECERGQYWNGNECVNI